MMKSKIVAGIVAVLSALYLLNPGFGIFDLLPDNMPGIGNLDEAGVTALLIWAVSVLRGKTAPPPGPGGS
jgi:uncharacterized membrane protein YkvA (DUF1232 family)